MNKIEMLLKQIKELSYTEKQALNSALVSLMRAEYQSEAAVKAGQFNIGDVVRFMKSGRGRNAGLHYVKVLDFNRARTAVVGPECDKEGKEIPFAPRWTVAATTCVKVK